MTKQEIASKGFDAGNYANAYTNEDFEMAFDLTRHNPELEDDETYYAAFLLGFFASYELDEIPRDCIDSYLGAYYTEGGQIVRKAGYIDEHDGIDEYQP